MKKVPTLYIREVEDHRFVVPGVVTFGCQWVLDGEGVPTRKFDGTCVMLDEWGRWWARRQVRPGVAPPEGWVQADVDEKTNKRVGWEPIVQSPFARLHAEALARTEGDLDPGTYELIGPRINDNPEGVQRHELVPHGSHRLPGKSPEELIEDCRRQGFEGVVWHHPDGRMVKLKVDNYPPEREAS